VAIDSWNQLEERLRRVGLEPPSALPTIKIYFSLLAKWNRRINLTALPLYPPSDEAIDRLLVEPIAASRFAGTPERIIDLGSGGGSPAIPFWLGTDPSGMIQLVMVESRSKKCAFLREAVRFKLRARVIEQRFEDLLQTNPDLRSSADIVTIRAVRLDEDVRSLIGELLAPNGRVFHFTDELVITDCSTWNKPRSETSGSS
jgi:16S rRNA (guanine527-N7)-methyltransferase